MSKFQRRNDGKARGIRSFNLTHDTVHKLDRWKAAAGQKSASAALETILRAWFEAGTLPAHAQEG